MRQQEAKLPIEQLLELMRKAFESRFSCEINFYTGDFVAVIHFYDDKPLGDPLLSAKVYSSGKYEVLPPRWVKTDIHPLTVAMKRADTLLGLLQALYQT